MLSIERVLVPVDFSSHADQAVADYLVEGALSAEGTVCQQDWVPFGGSPTTPAFESAVEGRQKLPT